jgi:L-amino acid N-acyltransferase YncA
MTPTTRLSLRIRAAEAGDIAALSAIYAHHVVHGLGTFETEAPSFDEMTARWSAITGAGFPYLVAVDGDRPVGYAYASHFRTRAAYRHTVEDSVYVAPDRVGRGVGSALLAELVECATALGLRQMLALIGDSANAASIGVHRVCGFTHVGTLTAAGYKAGRWVDVVIMQRALGAGDTQAPAQ